MLVRDEAIVCCSSREIVCWMLGSDLSTVRACCSTLLRGDYNAFIHSSLSSNILNVKNTIATSFSVCPNCRLAPATPTQIYLYLSMNSLWNLTMLPTHSVPGAKKVVRKCRVPSRWPNPEPGTTQMPVASSRRRL